MDHFKTNGTDKTSTVKSINFWRRTQNINLQFYIESANQLGYPQAIKGKFENTTFLSIIHQ